MRQSSTAPGLLLQRGMAQLPDLHVSDSSEAMLSGRKPPFRLLVRAVATDGRKVNIRHAVSEGFVVRCPAHLLLIPLHCDALCPAQSGVLSGILSCSCFGWHYGDLSIDLHH